MLLYLSSRRDQQPGRKSAPAVEDGPVLGRKPRSARKVRFDDLRPDLAVFVDSADEQIILRRRPRSAVNGGIQGVCPPLGAF